MTFTTEMRADDQKWTSFVVDFLSPLSARLHEVDSTIDEFSVVTKDTDSDFERFLSLGRDRAAVVRDSNRSVILSLSAELGNSELSFGLRKERKRKKKSPR
jgi:hypothetical protein